MQDLTEEQTQDLNQLAELGYEIANYYGFDNSLSAFENLDNIFTLWREDANQKPSDDEIVLGLGAVFGNELLHKYPAQWVFINDDEGETYGLMVDGKYRVLPISTVANRVFGEAADAVSFASVDKQLGEMMPDLKIRIDEGENA